MKSGGKTRRAAKMNTLKDWHPDIIEAKTIEEKKAWALIEQGYDGSYNGGRHLSGRLKTQRPAQHPQDHRLQHHRLRLPLDGL